MKKRRRRKRGGGGGGGVGGGVGRRKRRRKRRKIGKRIGFIITSKTKSENGIGADDGGDNEKKKAEDEDEERQKAGNKERVSKCHLAVLLMRSSCRSSEMILSRSSPTSSHAAAIMLDHSLVSGKEESSECCD